MAEEKKFFNAGDEASVAERKTKAQLKQEKINEELRQICQDRKARDFIWRLLEKCGVYHESFTGNSTTFFNEGKRSIGLKIIADLMRADPRIYAQMCVENSKGELTSD